jgi:hypothetical protein
VLVGEVLDAWMTSGCRGGESFPFRRLGIRRLRWSAWHDDGSRASRVPVVTEAGLLLQFLIVTVDQPAQLDQIDEIAETGICRQFGEPVFGSGSPLGHSIRHHSSGLGLVRL